VQDTINTISVYVDVRTVHSI